MLLFLLCPCLCNRLSEMRAREQINMLRSLPIDTKWYKAAVVSPLLLAPLYLMCEQVETRAAYD